MSVDIIWINSGHLALQAQPVLEADMLNVIKYDMNITLGKYFSLEKSLNIKGVLDNFEH